MSTQVYNATGGGLFGLFPYPIISDRDPVTTDIVSPSGAPYSIFQGWNNRLTDNTFFYLGGGNWVPIASIAGDIITINSNAPIAGNYVLAGTANQISVTQSAGTSTFALIGPYTPATYTAHGVLMGEGTASIAASSAGTAGQVFTSGGASADGAYQGIGFASGLTGIVTANGASAWTANAVTQFAVIVGGAANAAASIAVGATGEILAGVTGANPAWTGSPSVSGTITAGTGITSTLGDITASAGNIVATLGDITASAGNIVATLGNLNLNGAASKININVATGASASAGVSGAMSGGAVTVTSTAITTTSIVIYCRNVLGTAMGNVSKTAQAAGSFVLTSDEGTETSTFNWWVIN